MPRKVICPECRKPHEISDREFEMFGPDAQCIKCVDWKHMQFMRKHGKKMKMSCAKGCRCGFGS